MYAISDPLEDAQIYQHGDNAPSKGSEESMEIQYTEVSGQKRKSAIFHTEELSSPLNVQKTQGHKSGILTTVSDSRPSQIQMMKTAQTILKTQGPQLYQIGKDRTLARVNHDESSQERDDLSREKSDSEYGVT